MKKHLSFLVLLTIATGLSYGQANTSLSNLTAPTAVNQNLLPDNNNARNLGTPAKSWRVLYIDSALYLKDTLFLHNRGTQNTFVGLGAGNSLTTGKYNTAGGYKSLSSNTTGNYNTAYGQYSMYLNAIGNQNTAFGESSLYSNNTGYCNVALGQASLFHNNNGFFNSGLGFETLHYNIDGSYNTASGSYALFNNTTGNYNTASGYYSLSANNIGEQNTAAGSFSLYSNTTGSNNVINGYKAGRNNLKGSNNVFVGWQAGFNNTDGSDNVFLGFNTGGVDHLQNTVVIGAGVNATQNNTIILGTTQNVGIGTTKPTYRLSVNGTIQSKEVRVETNWADYVFDKNYKLCSLDNLTEYITQNKHLPGIPSAKEIQENGLAVGEVQTKMMEKIEELTLYVIELKKEIEAMKNNQPERK